MKIVTTCLLGFVTMSLSLILKKGKTERMISGTAKRLIGLNGRQLALNVNGTLINHVILSRITF